MIELLIVRLRQRQAELSEGVMRRPKSDHAENMLQVGRWQGLQESLDILEEIIRDQDQD